MDILLKVETELGNQAILIGELKSEINFLKIQADAQDLKIAGLEQQLKTIQSCLDTNVSDGDTGGIAGVDISISKLESISDEIRREHAVLRVGGILPHEDISLPNYLRRNQETYARVMEARKWPKERQTKFWAMVQQLRDQYTRIKEQEQLEQDNNRSKSGGPEMQSL